MTTNNVPDKDGIFIANPTLATRIVTLADAVGTPPSVVVQQFCRYGIHNYEEVLESDDRELGQ